MSDDELLDRLVAEQDELRFARFDFDDAYAIGNDLVAIARERRLAIAIDIAVAGQRLFHAALPGTSPDNDRWIERKKRVVAHFFRSSYFIAKQLEAQGETIEAVYGLPSAEYAASGGALPIVLHGGGVVGTITVSGLPHEQDHRLVADAIRRHHGRCAVAGSPA